MTTPPNLWAARQYLDMGWSVIPMSPRSKRPLIPWKEFQTRRPSHAELNKWWADHPKAGVGMVTGAISGVVVVDVDQKALHMKDMLPDTPVVSITGSGGYHYFYAYPESEGTRVRNVVRKDGFDVRADGGYIVLPPSDHVSGNNYAWRKFATDFTELPAVPKFVLRTDDRSANLNRDQDNWLSRIMEGVGAGERNDAAARLAGYYIGKNMPQDIVLQSMVLWNERNDPPLPRSELVRTLKSVHDASKRPKQQESAQLREHVDDPFALVPFSEYMTKFGSEEMTWAVEGWLPDRTIALLVAPPGTYKTWLELELAISIATGLPFLGQFKVQNPGPVIIVQQEDFHGQMAERIGSIVMAKMGLNVDSNANGKFEIVMPPDMPIYLHPDRRLKFSDTVVLDTLRAKIAAIKPRLVIIDPLYSTGETDDYFARTVSQMFALKSMRDEFGCSFALAHHTAKVKKGEEGSTAREGAWGSQFINAFLETGWQIRQKDVKDQIVVRRHFKSSANIDEVTLKVDISTVRPYRYCIEVMKVAPPATKADHADYMTVFEDGGSFTIEEIADKTGRNRSVVSRKLKAMVTAELLKRAENGRYSLANDILTGTT